MGTMHYRAWTAVILAPLLAAIGLARAQESRARNDAPLTPEQVREVVGRAIANQHSDDSALEEYDRTERVIERGQRKDGAASDTTARVVPGGIGDLRVELDRDGIPADSASLKREWEEVENALAARCNADDPLVKQAYLRTERRNREHAEMVDAIGKAFRFEWAGRTTRDGRAMIKLAFEPDPAYKSSSRIASVYAHSHGMVWVDESSGHVARAEVELREDVSFGAGLIAKVYRGSRITLEQSEVAPGVWFPTRESYDIEGRKFLFPASWRGQIEASGYRRLGPPPRALELIRRERGETASSEREEVR